MTNQHKSTHAVMGIFGNEAKKYDSLVNIVSQVIIRKLEERYPQLIFRHRTLITKAEINTALQKVDEKLGQTLYVQDAAIKPDRGIKDKFDNLEGCLFWCPKPSVKKKIILCFARNVSIRLLL